jgi:hypothetical protein
VWHRHVQNLVAEKVKTSPVAINDGESCLERVGVCKIRRFPVYAIIRTGRSQEDNHADQKRTRNLLQAIPCAFLICVNFVFGFL